jgi:hypothetical protein
MKQNADISKELRELSDLVADLGKKNVYRVPEGYFETLPGQILEKVYKNAGTRYNSNSADEEIMAISPLLAGLKNKQAFSVPDGYFEQLAGAASADITNKSHTTAPVYSIGRGNRWIRYAAAAIVTGAIGIGAFFFTNRHSAAGDETVAQNVSPAASSGLKDISDAVLSDYLADMPENQNTIVDSADAVFYNTAFTDISDKDLASMIQEIPDDDLFSYQDDIQIRPVSL